MPSSSSSAEHPTVAKYRRRAKPAMVKISPGLYAPADPHVDVPETGVGMFFPDGKGRYEFSPVQERMVKMTEDLLERLGMKNRKQTMLRLSRAGFIEIVKPGPGIHLLNLDSWFNHLARVAEDPEEFWDRAGANFKHYEREGLS